MTQFLGWTATILFTICYIPQIVKMITTKKVEDISFGYFSITFIANIIALIYAALIHQAPLEIKYVLGLLLSLMVVFYYLKYHE